MTHIYTFYFLFVSPSTSKRFTVLHIITILSRTYKTMYPMIQLYPVLNNAEFYMLRLLFGFSYLKNCKTTNSVLLAFASVWQIREHCLTTLTSDIEIDLYYYKSFLKISQLFCPVYLLV